MLVSQMICLIDRLTEGVELNMLEFSKFCGHNGASHVALMLSVDHGYSGAGSVGL